MRNILQLALNAPNLIRSARLIAKYIARLPAELNSFVRSFLASPFPSEDIRMRLNTKCAPTNKLTTIIYVNGVPFSSQLFITPGSSKNHHLYPGGLIVHTALNLRALLSIINVNRNLLTPIDQQQLIAAHILHDLFKAYSIDWKSDGIPTHEGSLGETGAHHIFALAEILKKNGPFLLAELVAYIHDDDIEKVKKWLDMASQLAGKRKTPFPFKAVPRQLQLLGTLARLAEVVGWKTSIFCETFVRERLYELAKERTLGYGWPEPGTPEERWTQNIMFMIYGELKLYAVACNNITKLISYCHHTKHELQQLRLWPLKHFLWHDSNNL